jgi:hypothetical protein
MRIIKNIGVLLCCSVFLLTSCKKDTTDNVSKTVKVSFPTITLKVAAVTNITVGGAFTDQGAVLKDDISGKESDIMATSGSVNTAKAGLYVLNYSAANSNGFETVATRLVAVTSVNDPVNYSGTYLRAATGISAIIAKVSNGVYKVTNPGGAGVGVGTIVYFVETAVGQFVCPAQPTDAGDMSVTNITITGTGSSWIVNNPGYGTALRTFVKQ